MKAEKTLKAEEAIKLAAKMSKEYYKKPLVITYSGGKDSDVMLAIAEKTLKAEEFEIINSHTTVDAPQTVYHIRNVFKRLNSKGIKATVRMPKETMWELIVKKQIPPTRIQRYCCAELKETSIPNRIICVGVRADESLKRQGRDIFSTRGGTYKNTHFFR